MSEMEFKNFIALVKKMRSEQCVYFATRTQGSLIAAKELEKKVDEVIKDYSYA